MTPAEPQDRRLSPEPSVAPAPVPSATERREAIPAEVQFVTVNGQWMPQGTLGHEMGLQLRDSIARAEAAESELAALAADRDAKIEALQAEVAHWKHHAWEAGEGFARAIEGANRAHAYKHAAEDRADAAESRARAAEGELRQVREATRVGVELDNHHNAALCPYCTPRPASVPDETTQPATTDDCAGEGRTCETHGAPWVMSDSGLYIVCEAAELGRPASPVVAPSATDEEGAK